MPNARMQVAHGVRAVQVPDDNPMHPLFTNIYLVGDGQALTIDSGEAMDRYRWMLKGYLAAVEKSEIALAAITHHHADHSGNLKWAREGFGAEIVAPKQALPLLKGRLPKNGVNLLADGQVFDLAKGVHLRAIFTPGHSVDSVCYYLEEQGVLFTGDTLLGSSTTTVGDLGAYRRSLELLLELPNLKVICPGHGALVNDPRERLQQYVAHRDMRERQILDALKGTGPATSWDIMLKLYPEIDKRLRRAADNNVRAHLRQLQDEGRIAVQPGKPKRLNATKQQRDVEHGRERERVIKLARKYESQRRRDEIRRQENPPSDEWSVAPKYELK
ncbi:MAG TPA: MBL fold metallo-hydrolase [Tepidiformaceae bacterium]|nr:MBL fold metallo-hydrolase [Tepidiformaceae bacterium]